MTWTTRPMVLVAFAVAVVMCVFSSSALERRGTADDLGDLLRDLRLAGAVVGATEQLQHVTGVVGGVLHRRASRGLLGRDGLDERAIDRIAHVRGQELGEDGLCRGEE